MSENNSSEAESVSNKNVKRILALLREGDEKIDLAGFRDVIIVLGNTGSGKSTLIHYLATNNDDLMSTEVGENEFIISDTHNKISVNSTIISKTTFPEVIIDHETKSVFIDCPGFNDSRNEAYDIAAAYFIKKVLESVKNVKIILTVSYPSLRKGVNRNDFHQLLEHTTILIKHIEKYVDGVSLVATKVDNNYSIRNGVPTLVSDNSVLQSIGQFLLEVRESFKTMKVYTSEFKRAENELFFENSKKLLDTLLRKNGTEYTRLGIFRRPDGPGRISDSTLLQNGKKIIKRMLKNNLNYVPVDMKDFGYAVSDKSKNIINDLVNEIDKNIAVDVAQINEILINYSKEMEEKMIEDDMYSLREYLNPTIKALAQISSIEESTKADQLVSRMQQNLPNGCKKSSETYFNDMKNLGKFLIFLQDVSNKQFDSLAWKWIKQLEGSVNYVQNSIKWYDFLAALQERLSQYDVQTDTSRFHVPEFNSTGTLGGFVEFTKFFDEITTADLLKVTNFKEMAKIDVDETKIRYFNRLIESTLRNSSISVATDSDDGLEITGEYVKLADVVELLENDHESSKSVRIFAKNTIFIDADLTKNIDISIIAPVWDIIGSRTINLDGLPGSNYLDRKAADGINQDGLRNGNDGLPGTPGESAGHFFGIGDIFKHPENLTIRAVGGTGGNGQHGGDGAPGKDGQSHFINDNELYLFCDVGQKCDTEIVNSKSGFLNLDVTSEVTYKKYGSAGGRGGNAGRGGASGIGGNAGSITLIGAGTTKPSVSRRVAKGEDGGYGLHGDCGQGGIGGFTQKAVYHFGTWADTKNYVDRTAGHGRDGDMGTCIYHSSLYNSNSEGRRAPAIREFLYPPALAISDFRTKLMPNFYNCFNKRRSLEFYEMLHKKAIIEYDSADIIYNELKMLETFHNRLSPDISKLIYTLFAQRIEAQAKTVTQPKQRKLLDFLSLAVSSKLTRFANRSQSRLVSNRQAYFDLLKTADVGKIRDFFSARAREEIESAGNFVQIVRNDISDIIERTGDQIVELSKADFNNELGTKMLKFKLFSNLKTIVEFIGFSVSLAQADLDLVKTSRVTSVLPSVQMDYSGVDGTQIEADFNFIKGILGKPIEAIRNSVLKERKSLKSLGMEYDEMSERLHEAEIILESRKPFAAESFWYSAISKVSDVMKNLIMINAELPNDAITQAHDISNKFLRECKLIGFDAELFLAMMDSRIDTESLTSTVDSIQDRADHIRATVDELFDLVSPVFRIVKESMIGNRYKPENLIMTRMKIPEILDEAKSLVYKLIDQFEIDEDLQLMVENIDEAVGQMTTIFNDVFSSHHDRAIFNGSVKYLEKEEEFGNTAQNYLVEVVKANALFYEYERLVDIVKKFLFPFDVSYTHDPAIPVIDRSYQSSIITNVNLLESLLKSFDQNSTQDSSIEEFNGENENGAFFVWANDNYQESISKLLLGREIALKASNVDKNRQVLKFNDIRIRFQSNDPDTRQSLDEDLKNFNVIMTHTGSSYFSVCDRIELINQDAVTFVYDFNDTTTQVDSDEISPTMSPYTTWILKLIPAEKNVTFGSLLPYRKMNLNIELEGRATFVNAQNNTICQKIARSGYQSTTTSADQSRSIRKRRDASASESKGFFNVKLLKSLNPFNYFINSEPDPRFEHSPDPKLLEWHNEPNQPSSSPSLNTNAALTLVDFIVRNVTKVKPYRSKEKSISADRAREIAVSILFNYENMLSEVSKNKSAFIDWEEIDPVELLGQLEKYILAGKYSKVVDLLIGSSNLDPSVSEFVEQGVVEVVDRSLNGDLQPNNQSDVYESSYSEGALTGLINSSDTMSIENYNQTLDQLISS